MCAGGRSDCIGTSGAFGDSGVGAAGWCRGAAIHFMNACSRAGGVAAVVLALVLNPWSGLWLGHSDCTMGNQSFWTGWGTLLGLVLLFLLGRWRRGFFALFGVGLVWFYLLGLASFVNASF